MTAEERTAAALKAWVTIRAKREAAAIEAKKAERVAKKAAKAVEVVKIAERIKKAA